MLRKGIVLLHLITAINLLFITNAISQTTTNNLNEINDDIFLSNRVISLENNKYEGATFLKNVRLSSITFTSKSSFFASKFCQKVAFNSSIFQFNADFRATEFKDSVDFINVQFKSQAYFSRAIFEKYADFNRVKFLDDEKMKEEKEISFVSAKFLARTNFEYGVFKTPITFESAKFFKTLDLSKASFYKDVSFYHTQLPDTLILEGIKSKETIDLTHINLKKGIDYCYINLFDADIAKIKLRYDKFRLIMPKRIETDSLYEKTTYVYESLLKNFQDSGFLNSYETLDKEYQEFKFTQDPDRTKVGKVTGKFLNWLNWAWNDYGYSKVRIWPITIVSFFIFFLINLIFFNYFIKKVYNIPELRKSYVDNNEKSRLIINFFYTSFIFFGFKLKTENFDFKHPFASMYIFFQYMIGLVCMAYLANFVISSTLIGL